jgi:hypothetical protein
MIAPVANTWQAYWHTSSVHCGAEIGPLLNKELTYLTPNNRSEGCSVCSLLGKRNIATTALRRPLQRSATR